MVCLITTGNLAGVNLTFNVSSRTRSQSWGTSSWRNYQETRRRRMCWWGRWTSWTRPSWHLFACRRPWCWEPWRRSQFPQGDRTSLQTRSIHPCTCILVVQGIMLCLQIFIHLARSQRQGQVLPWDRQSHRHTNVRWGRHSLSIKNIIHYI